jgi:hypothetical protein
LPSADVTGGAEDDVVDEAERDGDEGDEAVVVDAPAEGVVPGTAD